MVFTSLIFLFLFLPLCLGIYYCFNRHRKVQNVTLFLASLVFYGWGEPIYVLLLVFSIIVNWGMAWLIDVATKTNIKKLTLILSVIVNIGVLFVFKYLTFTVIQFNRFPGINIHIKELALPIGISFFTFQALSYVIDVYRGEKCQRNPLYVGLYISFFPQLIAGPIVRYNSISDQLFNRKETIELFKEGVMRFAQGFSKKVLLANTLAVIADNAFSLQSDGLTVSFAWLGAISYTLQIFFDFSGYSDMAIGLGKMFGFNFDENFNYPYISTSITDFWRRWHISLSSWFRDYVYIPLGGNRTGTAAHNYLNLFIVWFLTGFWHGANWTFLAWGLAYFAFLLLEKATFVGKILSRHKIIGHLYTLFIVIILWVIFRADGIHHAIMYIKTMFGFTEATPFMERTLVYIRENIVCIFFSIIFATDCVKRLYEYIQIKSSQWGDVLKVTGRLCLGITFIVSIVYIINGTYNPFIYFNF